MNNAAQEILAIITLILFIFVINSLADNRIRLTYPVKVKYITIYGEDECKYELNDKNTPFDIYMYAPCGIAKPGEYIKMIGNKIEVVENM